MNETAARRIDPEELAAYIDGRLNGARKQQVEAHLAENPEDYELFVDSARFLDEEAGLVLAEPDVQRAAWARFALPVAALVLLSLAAFWFLNRASSVPTALQLATALPDGAPQALYGDDWDRNIWSVFRGPGSSNAFRLGVRAVDLEVAWRAQDRASLKEFAGQISGALEASDVFGLEDDYKNLATAFGNEGLPLAELEDKLRANQDMLYETFEGSIADDQYFRVGLWAETARLAVQAEDEAVLRGRVLRGLSKTITVDDTWPDRARQAYDRATSRIASGDRLDAEAYAALNEDLERLISVLGRTRAF